jgi:hypothetical protein
MNSYLHTVCTHSAYRLHMPRLTCYKDGREPSVFVLKRNSHERLPVTLSKICEVTSTGAVDVAHEKITAMGCGRTGVAWSNRHGSPSGC